MKKLMNISALSRINLVDLKYLLMICLRLKTFKWSNEIGKKNAEVVSLLEQTLGELDYNWKMLTLI